MRMTIKEKVIRESIKRVTKKITEIQRILDASPLSDILHLRQKAAELHFDPPKSEAYLESLREMAEQEKKLFALAKKQRNTSALINKQVHLESELRDLNHELWIVQFRTGIKE